MKIQVLQENLAKALSLVSRFTSSRPQLPVLGNILLSAKKTKLLLASTNLETSISVSIGANIEQDGEITVPARVITELISNLTPGPLSFEAEKEQLKISRQNFSSGLLGMNSSDFPSIPYFLDEKIAIPFPAAGLLDSLAKVLFATSTDETRPILTGVLFIFQKTELTLVGTDGFRLSLRKIKLKDERGTARLKEKIILPRSTLNELVRLPTESREILFDFKEKEKQAIFASNGFVLSSRILEGEFPDFEKIIPKNSLYQTRTDKEEFLRAVKLASVFARDSANVVKMNFDKDAVEFSAESSQAGSQKNQVEATTEGNLSLGGIQMAFNYRFLEDFLQAVEGEEILVEFSAEDSPAVFRDTKDENFIHLIMPVRVQS